MLRQELAKAKVDAESYEKRQRIAMKYAWIDEHRDQNTISQLHHLLEVCRNGDNHQRLHSANGLRSPVAVTEAQSATCLYVRENEEGPA